MIPLTDTVPYSLPDYVNGPEQIAEMLIDHFDTQAMTSVLGISNMGVTITLLKKKNKHQPSEIAYVVPFPTSQYVMVYSWKAGKFTQSHLTHLPSSQWIDVSNFQ